MVFADRVIIYEGDTERMLIRKLATLEDFSNFKSAIYSICTGWWCIRI
ncbi:TOPRIM nucleotidyl transferase/hydrolase domain-containing protein [Paenibacillus rhizoplanae]